MTDLFRVACVVLVVSTCLLVHNVLLGLFLAEIDDDKHDF